MNHLPYLLTFAILLSAAFVDAEPSSKLEVECNQPTASTAPPEPSPAPENVSFRTDNVTREECLAYFALWTRATSLCSPVQAQVHCDSDPRGIFAISKTYIQAQCLRGDRTDAGRLTSNVHRISPGRAVTLLLEDHTVAQENPVHHDVIEPVRQQLVQLTVLRCVTPNITATIYAVGMLPRLVALKLDGCRHLVIEKEHFSRMRNVQMIHLSSSTIARLEVYTFTDLPRLDSLTFEDGLGAEFKQLQDGDSSEEVLPVISQAEIDAVRRVHCDCSFAWFRNFLQRKPHLTAVKEKGQVVTIGSYKTSYVDKYDVLSVDCARSLTYDNIRVGTQFSYNSTCYDASQC
ncbi:uncharacterized protein LOC129598860 [Paramacrobiotus metropolitanus]|uniref:uncharacterized protein LOC129598860 n=1 Tax=Paramacrobiotus metropolitanus TaxID=2943436 RepID=UPI002445781E|nr:uncharacterized protein LOC129598860 [Paramacrobiotus metropolitanus]XP_055352919.1 uncharacterized protein LOC129598860 [Paramacrobiotus metropolitanus]